ncbi:MAG: phosphonate ABC transporter, permease protein PhnE [Planctomycetota bacterium]|nr:MAG: phosphonate ABC transporter, permease protein PhnE [Planctomycetota bacterium]
MPEIPSTAIHRSQATIPATSWHLKHTIGPRGIGILLIVFALLAYSGHRVELDRAAVEIGGAVAANVGLKEESQLGSGMASFIKGMFPLAIAETTELNRLQNFDRENLPWFSRIETQVHSQRVFDSTAMSWTVVEREREVLVQPIGYLTRVGQLMLITIEMAFWATIIAITLAMPLGFLAASNLTPHPMAMRISRAISSFFRSMPELILAMIMVLGFGFGPVAGILALGLHTAGFFGKFFADDIENADTGPQEALRATGAGRLAIFRLAVLPQVLPQYAAYIQYILERNVRTATIIGIVGAGGIGVELKGRWDMFNYQHVATILLAIFITVVVLEQITGRIRRRMM